MIADWQSERNVAKYKGTPQAYAGSYIGLGVLRIDISPSETAAAGLAVQFQNIPSTACDLEPYNADSLSFLLLQRDGLLSKAMIDWDYYKVGIFEFVRKDNEVVAFWWQWDKLDYPGSWVRVREGMAQDEIDAVLAEFDRFRKSNSTESKGK
jgi:hypothetical protein